MDNKFFTFARPYLSFIDKGHLFKKPFNWLYTVMAIINLLVHLIILFTSIDNGVFKLKFKVVLTFILIWLITAFASWISFQIWWDRRSKITYSTQENDEFVATPAFSHFIQTAGETYGTWIGLVGFGFALFTTIILGGEASYLSYQLGMPLGSLMGSGVAAIFIMPIIGFLIIILSRFVSEQIKALVAIANNTKK